MARTTSSAAGDDRAGDQPSPPNETSSLIPKHPSNEEDTSIDTEQVEQRLRRKVDLRLCTIAGILCSLNLLDSGVISSASVTSMPNDLGLYGNRFSISIFVFTIASITFQLPATIAVRRLGPRIWFSSITVAFGTITLCTAFIHTWQEMIALRVLLGMAMSGIYPGLSYLISTWYLRSEQQTRYAFLQSGQITILATGSLVNYGLNHLNGRGGLAGWRYMFLVQGLITIVIGLATYVWMVDFPENSHQTPYFLTPSEQKLAISRITADRADVETTPFHLRTFLTSALDMKIYAFAISFFLLNTVSTALSYFLPRILKSGFGFSPNKALFLSAPPYYYSVLPVLLTSFFADRFRTRGPVIVFNCSCLIAGFCMLGFSEHVGVRYAGTFLATGAYVSNWAALTAYYHNNIAGQWKRVFASAVVAMFNGAGGVVGSFLVREEEAPGYETAIWGGIGSQLGIIGIVVGLSGWFWIANRRQREGRMVLEGIGGFTYTF